MVNNKSISLIIPCRNEQAALYAMLQKLPTYIDEVIVVDNNSTDNTRLTAESFKKVTVFTEKRQENGIGYGFAHQTGMKHATGDYIFCMDGDNTYPIVKVEEIIDYMEQTGADFVSCSRLPLSNYQAIPALRRLGIHILNMEVNLLYNYPMQDILTGMWAMKKKCTKLLDVTSGGWNYSPEIKLAAIIEPKVNFSEYHISHAPRFNGVSKLQIWQTGFDHLYFIAKKRFSSLNVTSLAPSFLVIFKKAQLASNKISNLLI